MTQNRTHKHNKLQLRIRTLIHPRPFKTQMGFTNGDWKSTPLLETTCITTIPKKIPKDSLHLGYIIYFTLGLGYLLPWNAFVTAIDYFSYLYPETNIDRIFAVVYMGVSFICLIFILCFSKNSNERFRINLGLGIFVVTLLVVVVMDVVYIQGQVGLYGGFYVTVGSVVLCGVADAVVQGGVIGSAGELPEKYMQAVLAGTAASGVVVSILRVVTKLIYTQDASGLRGSARLYFGVSIVIMVICIVFYNVVEKLRIVKYYKELKAEAEAMNMEEEEKGGVALWQIVKSIKWYGFGIILIYLVTLSIFPGYITEDVHSSILKDWYSILLIFGYNVFDLVGKSLTLVYVIKNIKIVVGGCVGRLLFFPLFFVCLHGPLVFRTEVPVMLLTCLMGLTNGYLTSVLMMMAPKVVQLQHAESAGVLMVLFLVAGLVVGSVVSWFWIV
ncbi:equilibrative nucleotide transporter 1-like [Benincasa hispida]|uniref:equilibrative nucleotide transporter 1-like n=1 Tax=Benincasa hispida TaxID=102211 RepID=UPI0018FF8766|nr:equilibrative nucleotide transporter 1-like [Benincasa hispida]